MLCTLKTASKQYIRYTHPCLRQKNFGTIDSERLQILYRRASGTCLEGAQEMSWTAPRDLGQLFYGDGAIQTKQHFIGDGA